MDILINYLGKSSQYISNHHNTHIILQFINSTLIMLGKVRENMLIF